MAKGSGMIEPMMATMLAFVTTDAAVPRPLLDRALREAVDDTFNAITVDGECSTNDTRGASRQRRERRDGRRRETTYAAFARASRSVCRELALGIVRGGEGATKLVTVHGDRRGDDGRRDDARPRRSRTRLLVKTAIHGGDPNWGRLDRRSRARRRGLRAVACARHHRTDRPVQGRAAARRGRAGGRRVPAGARTSTWRVNLGAGEAASTVWTCDLERRIRADQRRIPDLVTTHAAERGRRKDFLSVLDFDGGEIERCLTLPAGMKADRALGPRAPTAAALDGRHVAMLFDKPSLRTRIDVRDWRARARRAGGRAAARRRARAARGRWRMSRATSNAGWTPSSIRTYSQQVLEEFAASAARLHVINALTDDEHPCQAVADFLTLRERSGRCKGRTLAFVGDGNNVAASLAHARQCWACTCTSRARPAISCRTRSSSGRRRRPTRRAPAALHRARPTPCPAPTRCTRTRGRRWGGRPKPRAAAGVRALSGERGADGARASPVRCSCTACPRTAARK